MQTICHILVTCVCGLEINHTIYIYIHIHTYILLVKGKGRLHPITGHKGPEGEHRDSTTLSLTLALDGEGGQRHRPSALTLGKTRCLLCRRLSGPPRSAWTDAKNLNSTGIQSPDRPARSKWLYQLSYSGPHVLLVKDE